MSNFHPELTTLFQKMPKQIKHFENMIIYGACGIGKYSQVLLMLKQYSPSELKYDKKMKITTDKNEYIYHLSDCHYEIDMGLLGCNSKNIWHEIYLQITDIVLVNKMNKGIILCKNFHLIHNELLDIFYSYMQHNNKIKFILITEHLSFIPNVILSSCQTVNIGRPTEIQYKYLYNNMMRKINTNSMNGVVCRGQGENINTNKNMAMMEQFVKKIHCCSNGGVAVGAGRVSGDQTGLFGICGEFAAGGGPITPEIDNTAIMNLKELVFFSHIKKPSEIPEDIFNIICNNIINRILDYNNIQIAEFRDTLYDILIYNLEIGDCIWYIFSHFVGLGKFRDADVSDILNRIYVFLKYYNNNYRPIYHLESIMIYFIIKIHGYVDEI
jgi:hypothetical protein